MSKFIIRRALGLIPLLFGIVIISFVLMKAAPGGPAQQFQRNPRVTQTQIDEWLKRWCLSADSQSRLSSYVCRPARWTSMSTPASSR